MVCIYKKHILLSLFIRPAGLVFSMLSPAVQVIKLVSIIIIRSDLDGRIKPSQIKFCSNFSAV